MVVSRERPVPVTIDGVRSCWPEGTTVADLRTRALFAARPGRLLSVKGSVIETEGGEPDTRPHQRASPSGPSSTSSEGTCSRAVTGADTVEATDSVREPIPVKTRITGSGPVMRLANPGSVGVRARVVGVKSREIVSEKVLVPSQDMVVVRTRPRPHEKLVALTFDDGPWPGQTDKILEILEHEGVHATFFMLGVRVNRRPGARQAGREGGQDWPATTRSGTGLLTKSKPKEIKRQIGGGADSIYRATGVLPTWFRPPYGAINGKVWKQVRLSRDARRALGHRHARLEPPGRQEDRARRDEARAQRGRSSSCTTGA